MTLLCVKRQIGVDIRSRTGHCHPTGNDADIIGHRQCDTQFKTGFIVAHVNGRDLRRLLVKVAGLIGEIWRLATGQQIADGVARGDADCVLHIVGTSDGGEIIVTGLIVEGKAPFAAINVNSLKWTNNVGTSNEEGYSCLAAKVD